MKISNRMSRTKRWFFVCAVFCVFSVNVFAARSVVSDPTKTEAQLKLEEKAKADENIKDTATAESITEIEEGIDKLVLPEDTSLRFNVKEVRISGNTLISTVNSCRSRRISDLCFSGHPRCDSQPRSVS